MNIVVLAGGRSTEKNVSLASGMLIWKALNEKKHNAILVEVTEKFEKRIVNIPEIFANRINYIDEKNIGKQPYTKIEHAKEDFIGEDVLQLCKYADVVFIALHGVDGEDGRLQALFDLYHIRYTGSDYLASALTMNKHYTKKLLQTEEIRVPKGILVNRDEPDIDCIIKHIEIPCVIKPINGGSSVGITIVKDAGDIRNALSEAFIYSEQVLIEQYINGREFSVGVLDGNALPVIEIMAKDGFYDYYNKYHSNTTQEICPADISDCISSEMMKTAEKIEKKLGLRDYSRVDFILDERNELYCLEVNSLPGMTENSLLPKEAAVVGISFVDICDKIVTLALRHKY